MVIIIVNRFFSLFGDWSSFITTITLIDLDIYIVNVHKYEFTEIVSEGE